MGNTQSGGQGFPAQGKAGDKKDQVSVSHQSVMTFKVKLVCIAISVLLSQSEYFFSSCDQGMKLTFLFEDDDCSCRVI
jgi:hypothetical protein